MNRKIIPTFILAAGILTVVYGILTAPVANKRELWSMYECDRITKEARSTDVYCANPESSPEARRQITNSFVYSGSALTALGVIYFVISSRSQIKSSKDV